MNNNNNLKDFEMNSCCFHQINNTLESVTAFKTFTLYISFCFSTFLPKVRVISEQRKNYLETTISDHINNHLFTIHRLYSYVLKVPVSNDTASVYTNKQM